MEKASEIKKVDKFGQYIHSFLLYLICSSYLQCSYFLYNCLFRVIFCLVMTISLTYSNAEDELVIKLYEFCFVIAALYSLEIPSYFQLRDQQDLLLAQQQNKINE